MLKITCRKKNCEKFLWICLVLFMTCCSLCAKEKTPYVGKGEFVLASESSDFEIAGVNLYFFNKSEKAVVGFTVVFYLFDEDGEPVSTGRSNIALAVQKVIEPMAAFEETISLDKYFVTVPESEYSVDFFYVSKIVYEDGTTWKDPLGMMSY